MHNMYSYFYLTLYIDAKWMKDLNVIDKTITFLEENTGDNLSELAVDKNF